MAVECFIPGCANPGRHGFELRCRKPERQGGAIWSRTTTARLCTDHATEGLDIEIRIYPTSNGHIRTTTLASPEPPIVVDTAV